MSNKTRNKVELIGYVGKDPIISEVGTDKRKFAAFSLATEEIYKTKNDKGEVVKKTETTWHRIVYWGKLAEIVQVVVHKGDHVLVSGRIKKHDWTDGSGHKQQSQDIIGDDVVNLSAKRGATESFDLLNNDKELEMLNEVPEDTTFEEQ